MLVLDSSRTIWKDYSRPFTRPRVTAWGSACLSVDQSSKVTAGVFGQSRTLPVRERRSHSQFRAPRGCDELTRSWSAPTMHRGNCRGIRGEPVMALRRLITVID